MFFCKYNDPIYVKLEKLDIMIALASERNIDQVLLELKEYATEVDVDFVRKVHPATELRCACLCSMYLQAGHGRPGCSAGVARSMTAPSELPAMPSLVCCSL